MVDETKDVNKGTPVPGENKQTTAVPPQLTEIEQKALSMGWKPKDQWDGGEDDWRSAKDFVERQSFFDKISELKSTIWELKKDYREVYQKISQAEKAKYEVELRKLKEDRAQAAKEGDTEKVVQISDRMDEVKEQIKTAEVPQQTGPDPAFPEWLKEHPWYNTDTNMRSDADDFAMTYKAKNPNATFKEVLSHVTGKIKKMYPEKFETSKPTAPAVDTPSNTQRGNPRSGKVTEADLTDLQRQVMNKFIKLKVWGNIPEHEAKQKYINSIMEKNRG